MARDFEELDKPGMEEYVHKSGGQVIAKKGATFYAVAVSVVELCNLVLAASDSVATVSSMMHGEYGVDDVCLSVSFTCRTEWSTGQGSDAPDRRRD